MRLTPPIRGHYLLNSCLITINFKINQIIGVSLYITRPMKRGKFDRFAWQTFHYAVLKTEDNAYHYITNLSVEDITDILEIIGVQIQIHFLIFPAIETDINKAAP